MAVPLDLQERHRLCDLANELGPDAPTLCQGWTTADLIAHLVVRERRPAAAPGIQLGGRLGEITARAMEQVKAGGYGTAVARLREGPPFLPWGAPGLRTVVNLIEYFVHHEDIRRANGLEARTDIPEIQEKLWSLLRRSAWLLLRKVKGIGVELTRPRGDTIVARKGSPVVRITGEPGELVLYCVGRRGAAAVEIRGDADAMARLASVPLGL